MTTLKGHSFMVYFAKTNDEDKVRCKLCNRNLKSKRLFNLKKHLKMLHQLEFRPAKRVYRKKHRAIGSNDIAEESLLQNKTSDNKDSFCDISTATLASNDSSSGDSSLVEPIAPGIPTIKIEEERIQEVRVPECPEAVGDETTFEVNSDDDNNAETTSTQNPSSSSIKGGINLYKIIADQPFVKPSPRSWKNIRCFKEPSLLTDKDDINHGSKKKKCTALLDDPLDENTSSSKNDSFEQWVNKKKQLLELEVLEMRNYQIKLELWEKEHQLNVKSSKFTRGIEKTCQ